MHYEGPRRQGRFIKKDSKVLEKVSLKHFSFQEISAAKVISHDNYKRTIIHAQYHDEGELTESVRPPERFNQDLTPIDQMRPIIQLSDFTKDWERDKMLRKDRVMRAEDEEFDYEYEAQRRQQEENEQAEREAEAQEAAAAAAAAQVAAQEARKNPPAASKSAPAAASNAAATAPTAPNQLAAKTAGAKPTEATDKSVGPMVTGTEAQWASVAEAGAAIKNLQFKAPEMPSQPPQRPAREAAEASAADDFIPVHDPEQEAAKSYQARQALLAEQAAQLEELKAEAQSAGYQAGFRAGEEKGELQVRQNAGQMFGKVSELIHEFAGLKTAILDNVQENFYELCQAMAESLLKREFSIQPEAFVTVMRRAISEAVEPAKFRIHVHPELYDRLHSVVPADLKESLLKDAEVAPGDFKIESNLSVVDGNVAKIIKDLLAQADLNLYDEEDKAS